MHVKRRPAKDAGGLPDLPRDVAPGAAHAPMFGRLVARLKTFKGAIVAIAGVGAVLGGLAGYWNAYQAARGGVYSSMPATAGAPNAGPLSIVVLPFANLTGDPQQAYLADGLTAAVTADLSRLSGAFIVSASTAFAYKDKPVTAQQIGRELGVRFALQGGVQRHGDKIRINAHLADTATNAQLWSENFDGDQSDLFALQDLVTIRIGRSIGREMIVAAAHESKTRKTDPKAADLMLRARAVGLRPTSPKNDEEERALYRQALVLEPNNVQAMLGLGFALAIPAYNGFVHDSHLSQQYLREAHDLALKVKELDPNNGDVYQLLATYAASQGDYEGQKRASEKALSLDPKNVMSYANLADVHFYAGEPRKAIELLTEGVRLDPRRPHEYFPNDLGRAHFMLGDDDTAIDWLQKAVDTNPDFPNAYAYLAMAYARKGDQVRARAAAANLLRVDPKFSLSRFDAPRPGFPTAHREFWEKHLLPAGRLAGLPQ